MSATTIQVDNIRDVSEILTAVSHLHYQDDVQAIPALSILDRHSPGWLIIIFSGLTRLLLSLVLLLFMFGGLLLWLAWGGQWVVNLISLRFPNLVAPMLIILLAASGFILYRSKGVRNALSSHTLWTGESDSRVLRFALHLVEKITQGMMIIAVAFSLVFSFLPMALTFVEAIVNVQSWFPLSIALWAYVRIFYLPLLSFLWLVLLLIFWFKRQQRNSLINWSIFVYGGLGIAIIANILYDANVGNFLIDDSFWPFSALTTDSQGGSFFDLLFLLYTLGSLFLARLVNMAVEMGWGGITAVFVIFAILYPLSIAIPVSRIYLIPFVMYRKALYWSAERIQLRWRVAQAFRQHRRRNKAQVGGKVWSAVCREHLRRFTTSSVRRSYRRRFRYAHCPECKSDNKVYTDVQCIAMELDSRMSKDARQNGLTLYLNGLRWGMGTYNTVPVFDTLVVQLVDNTHELEGFVTWYENWYQKQSARPEHKSFKGMTVQISKKHPLEPNERSMLEHKGMRLKTDYEANAENNACGRNIYLREKFQERNQRLFGALKRVALLASLLLLLGILWIWGQAFLQQLWNLVIAQLEAVL